MRAYFFAETYVWKIFFSIPTFEDACFFNGNTYSCVIAVLRAGVGGDFACEEPVFQTRMTIGDFSGEGEVVFFLQERSCHYAPAFG